MNFFLSLFLEITNGTRGAVIIIIIMLVPLLRCQPHNANVIMVYGLGRKPLSGVCAVRILNSFVSVT